MVVTRRRLVRLQLQLLQLLGLCQILGHEQRRGGRGGTLAFGMARH